MIIHFSPQRRDDTLTLEKSASDRLRVNGELIDFNSLNDGDVIQEWDAKEHLSEWFAGPIKKENGEIHVTVTLPYRFSRIGVATPGRLVVTDAGPIALPKLDPEVPSDEEA